MLTQDGNMASVEIQASFAIEGDQVILMLDTPDGPIKRSIGKTGTPILDLVKYAYLQGREVKAYEFRLLVGVGGSI
jgi:hypothetical protein